MKIGAVFCSFSLFFRSTQRNLFVAAQWSEWQTHQHKSISTNMKGLLCILKQNSLPHLLRLIVRAINSTIYCYRHYEPEQDQVVFPEPMQLFLVALYYYKTQVVSPFYRLFAFISTVQRTTLLFAIICCEGVELLRQP